MAEYDPLNPNAVAESRAQTQAADKLEAQGEVADMQWLLGNKRGRRVVWHLMDRANLFGTSFNTNSMTMAQAEGAKREAQHWQRTALQHFPDLFTTMLKEAGQ